MAEMVVFHGSIKEIWEGANDVHPVKDQITVIKETDTFMPTLLTILLQLQFIVYLNKKNLIA